MLPHAAHAREVVLELRQLDLELPFGRDRVLREDVEDELRPVDDARLEHVLQQPLLRRRELVVDEEDLGLPAAVLVLELVELPLADVAARIGLRPVLDDAGHGLDARRAGELLELPQLVVGVHCLPEHGEDEPALGLAARRRIGLSFCHWPSL